MAFFQEPMLMAQKSPQTTCWIIQEKALPKNQVLREVLGLKTMFPIKGGGDIISDSNPWNQRFPWGKLTNAPPKAICLLLHPSLNERARKNRPAPQKRTPSMSQQRPNDPGKKKLPNLHLCLRMAPTGRFLMDLWDPLVMGE